MCYFKEAQTEDPGEEVEPSLAGSEQEQVDGSDYNASSSYEAFNSLI